MSLFNIVWFGLVAFFVVTFIRQLLRSGGIKAAMFGAKIVRTVGEVGGHKHGRVSSTLKVHSLSNPSGQSLVGLELVTKSFASFQMMPVTLTADDARKLASLLQAASS